MEQGQSSWLDNFIRGIASDAQGHLTEHGVVEAARLYESPFTDRTPQGPDSLFKRADLDELLRSLEAVRASAVAA